MREAISIWIASLFALGFGQHYRDNYESDSGAGVVGGTGGVGFEGFPPEWRSMWRALLHASSNGKRPLANEECDGGHCEP